MRRFFFVIGGAVLALALWPLSVQAQNQVIINEIHYNPDVKTEPAEFVELFNRSTQAVDLGGWQLASAIEYTFPPGTTIAGRGYLVVAQNPEFLLAKFGARALGPYTKQLSKYGERIALRDSAGQTINEVNYQLGFPWPTVGDPPGYSIELINPELDNNLGGSWRASLNGNPVAQSELLIADHSVWKFRRGTNEASVPASAWRAPAFDDSGWESGPAPIGYDSGLALGTPLPDMNGAYSSVFFRSKFVVNDVEGMTSLLLEALYDDGFKVWINGSNVLNANISTDELPFDGVAGPAREDGTYNLFTINPGAYLAPGTNVIAIQAHNSSLDGSSDFYLDLRLRAQYSTPNRGPTPGARNSVYAPNAPPQIRQVAHLPEQPASGQTVKITAKITDPNGVASVLLQYQVVEPGKYIELTDAAYQTNWVTTPMRDDGTGGDVAAGDSIFTADLPGSVQAHRRLVRYRITAADTAGQTIQVPYADDPQPNFAYFVYDGVPGWRGAARPGTTAVTDFGSNVMGRLPVFHLIAKSNSVATATWFSRYWGDLYPWAGTLVYDGKVYDHIHYRARGGVWRYSMCKNMWKFELNRGHDMEVRDNWGRKYQTAWTKVNLGACIQQGDFNHRGEQGMFESVGFRLFQLLGVTAPNTTFATFRVIDDALEADPKTQYEGDFWGLYLAIEQESSRYLEEHGLPDGNLYKMEGGTGELNNLGPDGPIDKSDLNQFLGAYNSGTNASLPDSWWRANLNLPAYYGYQCVIQAIHHYDIADGKNYLYYRNPESRRWEVFVWDLDLTWADNMYRSGQQGGDEPFKSRVLGDFAYPGTRRALSTEFRNRVREFRDLMWNSDQVFKLIDEHAALLRGPASGPTILDADRSMWDYNPKMTSYTYSENPGSKAGTGRFYQWPNEPTVSKDFNGAIQLMKNYVGYRATNSAFSLDTMANEPLRPNRPVLAYTGPAGYPGNRLSFRASNFSSPYPTNQFAAMQWRVAEITDPLSPAYDPAQPWAYEITPVWESGLLAVFNPDLALPAAATRIGHRYRARVRLFDQSGRASNWSLPVEFTSGEPDNVEALASYLRLTELMYNPPPGGYEYIELRNTSDSVALELSGARFSAGVDYTFPANTVIPPGGYLAVIGAASEAAFRAYYGLDESVSIAGPYSGSLNNGGETLTLQTGAGGTNIFSVTYKDSRGWPAEADGAGHSLVLLGGAESLQNAGAADYGGNWRASTYLKGSPGSADFPPAPSVVLNEIAAHTHLDDALTSNDWIELYNPTDIDIVLGPGWYLSDDGAALTKWQIPAGTVIRARDWVSFDEITGFHNPANTGFGLSQAGEQVFLSYLAGTAEDRIVDSVVFKGQELDWTWGRYPDGGADWCALRPATREGANAAPPPQVVINEVMYHPPDIGGTNDNTLDEYIELYNAAEVPLALFTTNGGWRIDGGVSFVFPTNLTLASGAYLVLVNFNPATNAAQLAAFRTTYGLTDSGPLILGPYGGKLDNRSDRLALERIEPVDAAGSAASWVVVDEVVYADQPPWSCGSDGAGNALHRVNARAPGGNPLNWAAEPPTPGAPRNPLPPAPPTILAQPASQAVATNGTASFSVAGCGTSPFTYQWRHDGTDLAGATNPVLVLYHARAADAGEYRVVMANAAGAVTSQVARLSVLLPPMIAAQPQSQTVLAGATASFSVTAEGGLPLQYQWRFNGTNLAGATSNTLVLTNAQPWQAGRYTLVVFNAAGAAASSNVTLTVHVPATILVPPLDVIAKIGSNATFTVTAIGTGDLTYQWQWNGADLPGATSSTLTISNVQPAHAGSYTVMVSNLFAAATSLPAVLAVLYGPTVVEPPQSQIVAVGSDVVLTLVADGTLPMSYRWRRNNGFYPLPYLPTNSYVSSLVITNAQLTNSAAYNVYLTNFNTKSTGVNSPMGYLTVVAPPTNLSVEAGADAIFTVVVANPSTLSRPAQITCQWQWNGVALTNEARLTAATNAGVALLTNTLVLPAVRPEQAGAYAVVVSVLTNVPIAPARFAATLSVGGEPDRDGDGLPDAWELAHGLNPDLDDALADPDQDGMSNRAEYLAGTDPRDGQSFLRVELEWNQGASQVVVRFGAVSNKTYSVLYQDRLSAQLPWSKLADVAGAPTNRTVRVPDPSASAPARFYRLTTPSQP